MKQYLAIFSSLIVFVCQESFAQPDSSDIERITTTSSRLASIAQEQGGALGWLDEQALSIVNPQHIEQVINRIAGVNLQRGNGQEYLPAVRSPVFTGAGACGELLTAEDGIALRAAGFCNINELFEAGTEYAQGIEVLKGPGTVVYGSNAIHGVINVLTQDPISAPNRVSAEWGSYGYQRGLLTVGNDSELHGLGAHLSVTDDNGYRDNEGLSQQKLHLRYRHEVAKTQLEIGVSANNLDQETAGYIVGLDSYKNLAIARSNANPEAYRKATAVRGWAKISNTSAGDNRWQVTPYFRWQDMEFLMHFLPGQPLEENSQQSVGVLSTILWQLRSDVELQFGADAEVTHADLAQTQAEATPGSAFLQATIPAGKQYDYQVDATQIAGFAQVNWQVSLDWRITVGLRAESMRYDYDNRMVSGRVDENGQACGFGGCRYSRPEDRKDSFFNLTPRVSLYYQVDSNAAWYATLGQGYRAPQATELYRLQRGQSSAELDSVSALNAEVGYQFFANDWQLQTAVYAMNKDNVIIRDSDFFNRSDAKTQHRGIEVSLRLPLSDAWAFATALSYNKHTYASDLGGEVVGNDMDTAPRWLGGAQLEWQPSSSLRAELDWEFSDDYFIAPENSDRYNGHHLFHLRGVWQITPQLTATLQINNLFDRAYAERADFTTFSGPRYFPGEPRNGQLGVQYYF
ncbi:TonB-dependent receptor [Alteromonas flava]|uniref:TonB-dependent receptor n=1 Tax=Alteromonas flava TaxID=2048003 RepID=UPI000C28E7E0|nr:TonB-dependent receptor [Alteromonas flava]